MRCKGLSVSFSPYQYIFCHRYLLDTAKLSMSAINWNELSQVWNVQQGFDVSLPGSDGFHNGCCCIMWKSTQGSMWTLQCQVWWFTPFSSCLLLQNIDVFSPQKCDTCTRFVTVTSVRSLALCQFGTLLTLQLTLEWGKAGKQGISDSGTWKPWTHPFKINVCHTFGFKALQKDLHD